MCIAIFRLMDLPDGCAHSTDAHARVRSATGCVCVCEKFVGVRERVTRVCGRREDIVCACVCVHVRVNLPSSHDALNPLAHALPRVTRSVQEYNSCPHLKITHENYRVKTDICPRGAEFGMEQQMRNMQAHGLL